MHWLLRAPAASRSAARFLHSVIDACQSRGHTNRTQPAETTRAPANLVGCCSSRPVARTASSQDQPECRAARANSWATRIACSSAFPCPFGRGEALADSGREGRGRPKKWARAARCHPVLASPSLLVRARPACLAALFPNFLPRRFEARDTVTQRYVDSEDRTYSSFGDVRNYPTFQKVSPALPHCSKLGNSQKAHISPRYVDSEVSNSQKFSFGNPPGLVFENQFMLRLQSSLAGCIRVFRI